MASARLTPGNPVIETYGTSKDYSALSTWEAATDTDLVGDEAGEILDCYDDETSFDDEIIMSGATTDSTYFRVLRAASGEGHNGTTTTGFFLDNTSTVAIVDILESESQCQDLLMSQNSSDASSPTILRFQTTGTGQAAIACLVFDSLNSGSGYHVGIGANRNDTKCVLCAVINIDSLAGILGIFTKATANTGVVFYNCLCFASDGPGFDPFGTAKRLLCINCVSAGNTGNDYEDIGYLDASSNNADEDGTAPGTSSQTGTPSFVNTSTDFHLQAGDTVCDNNGTSLASDGTYPFDTDIDEEEFDTWDIGFDENDPAAAGGQFSHLGYTMTKT